MRKIIAILFIFSVFSCSSEEPEYRLIKETSQRNPFIVHSFPAFKGYFYEGSDKNFHYFIEKWKFQRDGYFKIRTDDLMINEAFMYGDRQVKVDPFQSTHTIEFGYTQTYRLYYTSEN
ncbi:hypothetical protein [Ascidiimonas sp. W6]|uniref:hypothetical protein n=1 Tax=Ascidiimonas meishanensis TaxID=3128903 RepID=UPI0030EC4BC7